MTKRLAVIVAVSMLAACTHTSRYGDADLVILNVTAIDAASVQQSVDVVIRGEQIEMISSSEQASRCIAQACIDGLGKYLIPGLWDAHVHLSFIPEVDDTDFFRLSLAHGVTALRDTGGHLELLQRARDTAGTNATPDLFVAGPLIDGEPRVYDGTTEFFPDISVGVATPAQARAQVDALAAQGVQLVKAYEMLTPDTFAALVDQASQHGLPVAAHSPLSVDALSVAASGVDDLQHLRNLEFACARDPQALLAERRSLLTNPEGVAGHSLRSHIHRLQRERSYREADDATCDALVEAMAKHGVVQTPTLTVSTFRTQRLFAQPHVQSTFTMLAPAVATDWLGRAQDLAAVPPDGRSVAFEAWAFAMVARLRDAGVPIMAGTDAPIALLVPGASLHEELKLLVFAGLSPQEALAAATTVPAAYFDLAGSRGKVEAGMLADLVLLNKDPLADIANVGAIEAVVRRGRLWDRKSLDALQRASSVEVSARPVQDHFVGE